VKVEEEREKGSVHVFVEEPLCEVGETHSEGAAMPKKKAPEDLKLRHCIISKASCLVSFFPK
jgi:hypothetical protein